MLCRSANGFGGLALAYMLAGKHGSGATNPLAPRAAHHAARAKSVIFLFMDGGPSQMDTFDPKPRLERDSGKPIPFKPPTTVFNISDRILGSPYAFRQHGQSGAWVSEIFPHVAGCVDDLAIIRSMVSDHSEHTAANYFMHSGSGFQGRPSIGAWLLYGLGSESSELPGFIVLESGMVPPGGLDLFGSGFLPASYQGTVFRKGSHPVADLEAHEPSTAIQQAKLGLLRGLNQGITQRFSGVSEVEATISNYELAFRMQSAVPALLDLSGESDATRSLYGLGEDDTEEFGRQCLLARRLVERGVRFIELLPPFRKDLDRWDQHGDLEKGHRVNAKAVDKPIAGLLKDLKARGLLDQTLVVWGGEFGRTPCAQFPDSAKHASQVGRDHNPFGFTMWLAGGGVKGGLTFGSTDEFGYFAVEDKVHIHDLHATILYLLGLDHKRLTYQFGGRDMRLTDVAGEVVHRILS
jgi:hypothetical protein